MNSNVLEHHGVKGQKWGVRRYQNANGTLTSLGKRLKAKRTSKAEEPPHEDYSKAHRPKNVKTMSDKELRDRINRLNMEKQYSQLSPSKIKAGTKYVNNVIKTGATVASVTTTALTIYNNYDKIKGLLSS